MNTLYSLTFRNLKLNKKRTIVTMIGIILATALICATAGLITSFKRTLYNNAIETHGNYHTVFKEVPKEEINSIKNHRGISYSFTLGNIGYSYIDRTEKEEINYERPYLRVDAYSKEAINYFPLPLTQGRMPENSNEIIVDDYFAKKYSNYKIGNTVKIGLGKRVDQEGNISDENAIYQTICEMIDGKEKCHSEIADFLAKETLLDIVEKEYTIVGIYDMVNDDYYYDSPGYIAFTLQDEKVNIDKFDVYVLYKDIKKYKEVSKEINPILSYNGDNPTRKYKQIHFEYLLEILGVGFNEIVSDILYQVMAIVIGVIVLSSIFVIKNGFSISVTERYKQFGMLSSVGATSKQIRRSVLFEGFLLGIIAIPLGILCGVLAVFILVHLVNFILGESLNETLVFYINYLPIVIAIIIGGITIFFSCLIPAIKASHVSAIESIRENNSIKIKKRKLKTPFYISKLFGIGGEVAYKNLKRNKRKYRTTVISLVVSIVVFIFLNSFINLMFHQSDSYFNDVDVDFRVYYYLLDENLDTYEEKDQLLKKKLETILSLGKINDYEAEKSEVLLIKDEKIIDEDFLNLYGTVIGIKALDEKSFQKFVKKVGGKVNDYEDTAILIDDFFMYDQKLNKYKSINVLKVKDNDTITVSRDKDKTIKVKRTKEHLMSMPSRLDLGDTPTLIVNETYFKEILKDTFDNDSYELILDVYMKTTDDKKIEDNIKEIKETEPYLGFTNYKRERRENRSIELVVSIFLYGFISVVTLIGVTNIFNTITTTMELRRREFAMLKAIGMTNKEFNKMIRLESILYGLKSLIIGIIIGLGLSYFLYSTVNAAIDTPFKVPVTAILICILFVFIIVSITMRYSLKKINKKNIIDTIREENI